VRSRLRLILAGLVIAASLLPAVAAADPNGSSSSFVSIGVGDTVMRISGQTSPGAFVTIADFGQIIGMAVADVDGNFTADFPAQREDIHKPSVSARDTNALNTETVLIPTSLYAHSTTEVSFFLPPTIAITQSTIPLGNTVPLHGQTIPSGVIQLSVDNNASYSVTADTQGVWSADLPTDGLSLGSHTVFAQVSNGAGDMSYATRRLVFNVTKAGSTPPPPRPVTTPPTTGGPIHIIQSTPPRISIRQIITAPLQLAPVVETRLPVEFLGGVGPYTVTVDWGDGRLEQILIDGSELPLAHKYVKPGSYNVKVYASDTAGNQETRVLPVRVYSVEDILLRTTQIGLMIFFFIFLAEHIYRRRTEHHLAY
jgi:hypothetical protein